MVVEMCGLKAEGYVREISPRITTIHTGLQTVQLTSVARQTESQHG